MTVGTGLGNCSSSFHSAGGPDQFATDFNLPSGTPFVAARAGIVSGVLEDQPSAGGGPGNRLSVDHGDGTSALYLHSPRDGILVEVGDQVEQGDTLGVVGQSGLAGYPHLHFIVVEGSTAYPYQGIPVSFRNADPADVVLQTNAVYTVLPY
jgi:murein DD-endopeptidase MepM/ murein hydrolase activator NlpD